MLATVCLLLAVPLLNGCHVRINQLRNDKRILEARNAQLSQDLEALKESSTDSTKRIDTLQADLATRNERIASLESELGTVRKKLESAEAVLNAGADGQTRELSRRLEVAMDAESALRAELDEHKTKSASLEAKLIDEEEARRLIQVELGNLKESAAKDSEALRQQTATLAEQKAQLDALTVERDKVKAELDGQSSKSAAEALALTARIDNLDLQIATLTKERDAATTDLAARTAELAEAKSLTEKQKAEIDALLKQIPPPFDKGVLTTAESRAKDILKSRIANGSARVMAEKDTLRLIISSDSLFKRGTTALSDDGQKTLADLLGFLNTTPHERLRVEGHTDNQPVVSMPYPDNWELAAARAAEVVRWLADSKRGMNPGRIVAESYGEFRPMAANNTVDGRRSNRRVELVLELKPQ